jgi:hypothetical protein
MRNRTEYYKGTSKWKTQISADRSSSQQYIARKRQVNEITVFFQRYTTPAGTARAPENGASTRFRAIWPIFVTF